MLLRIPAALAILVVVLVFSGPPALTAQPAPARSPAARALSQYIAPNYPPSLYDEVTNTDYVEARPELADAVAAFGRITGVETDHLNLGDGHSNGVLTIDLFDSPADAWAFGQAFVAAEDPGEDLADLSLGDASLGSDTFIVFQRGRVFVTLVTISEYQAGSIYTTDLLNIAGLVDARIVAAPPGD